MKFSLASALVLALGFGCQATMLRHRQGVPIEDKGCYHEDDSGETYRGLLTSTVSGRTCQKWTENKPHETGLEPTADTGLGNHNYCRNPDGSEKKPWCFTQDPNTEKEACDVPKCEEMARDFQE